MARVTPIHRPSDFKGTTDAATRQDFAELFELMFPGQANPEFKGSQIGWAILTAQGPRLALLVARLVQYLARDTAWGRRRVLRELAIQAINLHFRCDFSFQSHLEHGDADGLATELVAAIPYWRTTTLFDQEQRLVVEYTLAVVAGDVPEELFSRVAGHFGERETIEFTSIIGIWSFWAMLLNATRPPYPDSHQGTSP